MPNWKQFTQLVWDHDIPESWEAFPWPSWVPQETRDSIESFWSPGVGRSPADYIENMVNNGAPKFGSTHGYDPQNGFCSLLPIENAPATGRFIHAWNNIGRIIPQSGTPRACSFSGGSWIGVETFDDWAAEGRSLFGPDRNQWIFQCPACKSIQTADLFESLGLDTSLVTTSCLGRHLPQKDREEQNRCDYTNGGLFRLGRSVEADGVIFQTLPFLTNPLPAPEEAIDRELESIQWKIDNCREGRAESVEEKNDTNIQSYDNLIEMYEEWFAKTAAMRSSQTPKGADDQ